MPCHGGVGFQFQKTPFGAAVLGNQQIEAQIRSPLVQGVYQPREHGRISEVDPGIENSIGWGLIAGCKKIRVNAMVDEDDSPTPDELLKKI
jgi:hypothetical protein